MFLKDNGKKSVRASATSILEAVIYLSILAGLLAVFSRFLISTINFIRLKDQKSGFVCAKSSLFDLIRRDISSASFKAVDKVYFCFLILCFSEVK